MEAEEAVIATAPGGFADGDEVRAIGWGDDGDERVLDEEGVVVIGGELAAMGIEDGGPGIEHFAAEAHAFDLGGDAVAFFYLDGEVGDLFIVDDAVDGDVEGDGLGLGDGAIGAGGGDVREGADVEGEKLGDAGGGPDAEIVFAQRAVGGGAEAGVDGSRLRIADCGLRIEGEELDAGGVE